MPFIVPVLHPIRGRGGRKIDNATWRAARGPDVTATSQLGAETCSVPFSKRKQTRVDLGRRNKEQNEIRAWNAGGKKNVVGLAETRGYEERGAASVVPPRRGKERRAENYVMRESATLHSININKQVRKK